MTRPGARAKGGGGKQQHKLINVCMSKTCSSPTLHPLHASHSEINPPPAPRVLVEPGIGSSQMSEDMLRVRLIDTRHSSPVIQAKLHGV